MKKILFIISILICLSTIKAVVSAKEVDIYNSNILINSNAKYSTSEILVTLSEDESSKWNEYSINSFPEIGCKYVIDLTYAYNPSITGCKCPSNKIIGFKRILKIGLTEASKQNVLKSIYNLKDRNDIYYVGPNYLLENFQTESDWNTDLLINNLMVLSTEYDCWGLDKINIDDARSIIDDYNPSNVLVGVIENGINGSHEDLIERLSPLSISYSDLSIDPIVDDGGGHGTRVAGIIAANINDIGIDGVCETASIVSLKQNIHEEWSIGEIDLINVSQVIQCITYASSNGIRILNCSFGSEVYDLSLNIAMSNYQGLIICGAGNSYSNNDVTPVYPASFDLDNIISVGAIGSDDILWMETWNEFTIGSNYGINSVDVFAPGEDIYSTSLNDTYVCDSGTSYAAPYVAGLAAMILSIEIYANAGSFTMSDLKDIILSSVTTSSNLTNYCVTGGYINAASALEMAITYEPVLQYEYYSADYHTVIPVYGSSYLEEHDWVPVFGLNLLPLFAKPPLFFQCTKCGATRID